MVAGATCASVASFLWHYSHGTILYYGDAVAHITIARRVFDSLHPGPSQLGTVWLPLPHLLILPFVVSDKLWSSGIGGSFYSMAAYVFAVLGMFRLLRPFSRSWAWLAAVLFATNPNLLYLQSTSMTEPLSLALATWTWVYLMAWREEFAATDSRKLRCMMWCLVAGMLTRYDAWFAAFVVAGVVMGEVFLRREAIAGEQWKSVQRALLRATLLGLVVPIFWLAYNWTIYGNAFDFLNGPYSTQAISAHALAQGVAPFPGAGHPWVAWLHFLKAAKLNFAAGQWEVRAMVVIVLGVLLLLAKQRRAWPLLFLWVPALFYVYSIAYGGVTLYVPVWYPFTSFNARYGLHLLPAFCVFFSLPLALMWESSAWWKRTAGAVVSVLLVAATLQSVWSGEPICLWEAEANSRARRMADAKLESVLQQLPPNSTVMMSFQEHVGALQHLAFPLKRTVNETSKEDWERGLTAPAAAADYVIVFAGDPVDTAVKRHPEGLQPVARVEAPGEPSGVVYKSLRKER